MKSLKRAGFSSVFIVMLFASLIILLTAVFTFSLDSAAASIDEVAAANAGTNILTEYNKELYEKFGILAHTNASDRLTKLATYYIETVLDSKGTLVHSGLTSVSISTEDYEGLNTTLFSKQLKILGAKTVINESEEKINVENYYGDDLPSSLLNVRQRYEIATAAVKKIINLDSVGLLENKYISAYFSDENIEYIIFGAKNIASNRLRTDAAVYAIRLALDGYDQAGDAVMLLEAVVQAAAETEIIMNGGCVEFANTQGYLGDYLNSILYFIPTSEKMARTMDLMQLYIDSDFKFKNYAYGFDMTAGFKRGRKTGELTQTHVYI